ncbi:MAG TPA: hypothetical protein VFH88_11260 [Candidatus Krumholzibacteria bacterium]|nr:hypothetical protein [Candidatus Krumholzibacteria bacterium]
MRAPVRALAIGLATLLVFAGAAHAAWKEDVTLGGYLRESPFLWNPTVILSPAPAGDTPYFTNMVHTRQNLRVYFPHSISLGLELKTRLVTGDAAQQFLDLANVAGGNRTYFDWEHRFIDDERAVLAMVLDRAWLNASVGRTQITLGRQRVAWGTGLVWNPIDIFNPSSPLDFDNEEKPGADAGRVQVYLGPNSKLEVAVAPMRDTDETVAAVQAVVNRAGYDWIAVGGRRGANAVMGGAWAGSIRGGGFRGEFLYSVPRDAAAPGDPAGESCLHASVDGDYTFSSSLYLHGAVLYNQCGTTGDAGGEQLFDAYRLRWLTPARVNVFAEVGRDITALVHADLSGILNPNDASWYLGPAVTWSAATNLDVMLSGLFFGGNAGTQFGDDGDIGMLWLKWSF